MIRFIKRLGKLVVRLYNREANRLNTLARKESVLSRELALRSRELADSADANVKEAAHVASQAQQLAKFFE